MRASVFIATSLDGYIARSDGGLDWLPGAGGEDLGEDNGYTAFVDTVDVIVIGRKTFETVLTFGSWPYQGKPVVVLSSRPVDLSSVGSAPVEWMSGTPEEIVARLTERGARHAYVDGGNTIQRFLQAGLIQRVIITRVPVILGGGIPLFGPLTRDIRLKHIATRPFAKGLVQSAYVGEPGGRPRS